LISLLTRMEVDGRPATDEEVLVNCYAFIMGANPTIPQAASHLVLLAGRQPEIWERVRARRTLLPTALEELLRWSSPVNHLLRKATEEVVIGEVVVPAGGLVAAWIASANRDEAVFADPDSFDPARQPNPHVAFGYGSHRCIGSAAARTGLRLLIDEMATAVKSIELGGEVRHLASNFLNGITSLPVILHPADGSGPSLALSRADRLAEGLAR
jgi:cytochrome P450